MRITVLFFGPLRELSGERQQTIECVDGETLGSLFDRYPALAAMKASIVLARNREFVPLNTVLGEGDEVAFLPPVSGGAPEAADRQAGDIVDIVDIVEMVDGPIDARALVAQLSRGEDGAIVTFEGITRNNSKGRSTRYLEYESYREMALAQMQAIVADVHRQFPIDRVGMIHRLGRVDVGEASVVIVVTSAHRGPAFEACRFAIDQLKKSVAIWKKEFFTDGEVWVEGEVLHRSNSRMD